MGSVRHVAGESIGLAAASGDHRRALEAMRDKLAVAMDDAPDMVVAQIAARLQAVLAELAGLPVASEVSRSDELASRRSTRRSETKAGGSAAGGGKQRGG